MERYLTLDQIRDALDAAQPAEAVARLRHVLDALAADPDDIRAFERVVDDDYLGNEGSRTHYYLWRYVGSTPPGFTARIYVFAREDDAGEYVMSFGAYICPERSPDTWHEPDEPIFECAADAIAWLEGELGWTLDEAPAAEPEINEVR